MEALTFVCQNQKMGESKFEPACRRMEWLDPFYKAVWEKAYADAIPISGTFELTPRCNFNCRMCYVHLPESEIGRHGKELTGKEWIRIAEEAKQAGTTWLCITGGEPLMHPEFEDIWKALSQMGFFITLQTNASLIKNNVSLFEKNPPKNCKITLYGADDKTYENVCQVEKGFSRVDEGIKILKEMKIPVQIVTTVIRQNLDNVENIIYYVEENKLPWLPNVNVRTAGRGLDVDMDALRIQNRPNDKTIKRELNQKSTNSVRLPTKPCALCRDYRIGYWIVWNGYMRFCSFLNGPDIAVRDKSFNKCWKELIEFQENLEWPEECRICPSKSDCLGCAALFKIESDKLCVLKEFCKKRRYDKYE